MVLCTVPFLHLRALDTLWEFLARDRKSEIIWSQKSEVLIDHLRVKFAQKTCAADGPLRGESLLHMLGKPRGILRRRAFLGELEINLLQFLDFIKDPFLDAHFFQHVDVLEERRYDFLIAFCTIRRQFSCGKTPLVCLNHTQAFFCQFDKDVEKAKATAAVTCTCTEIGCP